MPRFVGRISREENTKYIFLFGLFKYQHPLELTSSFITHLRLDASARHVMVRSFIYTVYQKVCSKFGYVPCHNLWINMHNKILFSFLRLILVNVNKIYSTVEVSLISPLRLVYGKKKPLSQFQALIYIAFIRFSQSKIIIIPNPLYCSHMNKVSQKNLNTGVIKSFSEND
jgi:hypothetical protein